MKRPKPVHGFTLLELLVAVSITLIIAGLMLAVTAGTLRIWRRTQAGHAQALAARQAFDFLEQDFGSAIYRRDARRWLAVDILDTVGSLANHGWLTTAAGPIKPANGGSLRPLPGLTTAGDRLMMDSRFGLSGAWLRLIATNTESGGSLPALVSYQVVRRPVTGDPVPGNPAPVRYSLYRAVISNSDTFIAGYDVTAAAYASPTNTPYAAGSTLSRAPRNAMNPGHANLLAANVVDFGCWLHVRNADGSLRLIYPSAAGDSSHHAAGDSLLPDTRYPEVADVMLRILTDEGADMIAALESGRLPARPSAYATDAEWWWAIAEANSQVFVRRIEIKGTAL